ncbi:MAG: phosphoribosylanthranilate isomerase [Hyphomicrobiales bacterium]
MVKVKICGLSTEETLSAALEAGADYVGLVFYQPSPRHLTIEQARPLAEQARGKAKIVALTVDPDNELIDAIATVIKPDYIQCHGSESPERVSEISTRTGIAVIKAIKVRDEKDVESAAPYEGIASMLLFDAKVPEGFANPLPGGNGVRFDWSLLDARKGASGFMLSGGIDMENVAQAIDIAKPAIIDVSSGVESAPGVKDAGLVREFVERIKGL